MRVRTLLCFDWIDFFFACTSMDNKKTFYSQSTVKYLKVTFRTYLDSHLADCYFNEKNFILNHTIRCRKFRTFDGILSLLMIINVNWFPHFSELIVISFWIYFNGSFIHFFLKWEWNILLYLCVRRFCWINLKGVNSLFSYKDLIYQFPFWINLIKNETNSNLNF